MKDFQCLMVDKYWAIVIYSRPLGGHKSQEAENIYNNLNKLLRYLTL